jgi:hypothetical protein
MRTFDSQSSRDLGGSVDASLRKTGGGYTGTITNNTGHVLKECIVLCGQNRTEIGEFRPGVSEPVSLNLQTPSPGQPANGLFSGISDEFSMVNATVDDRMSGGTMEFLREASQDNGGYGYNYGYSGLNDEPLTQMTPSTDEALLIGWCQDDALFGPAIQIDGQPALENHVALVAVPIPLPK